jgi:hypothetical protein
MIKFSSLYLGERRFFPLKNASPRGEHSRGATVFFPSAAHFLLAAFFRSDASLGKNKSNTCRGARFPCGSPAKVTHMVLLIANTLKSH